MEATGLACAWLKGGTAPSFRPAHLPAHLPARPGQPASRFAAEVFVLQTHIWKLPPTPPAVVFVMRSAMSYDAAGSVRRQRKKQLPYG